MPRPELPMRITRQRQRCSTFSGRRFVLLSASLALALGSRVGGILPIASAAVIMGFGLFFLFRGVGQIA